MIKGRAIGIVLRKLTFWQFLTPASHLLIITCHISVLPPPHINDFQKRKGTKHQRENYSSSHDLLIMQI